MDYEGFGQRARERNQNKGTSGGGEVRRVLLVCDSLCFESAGEVFNLTRTGQSRCAEAKKQAQSAHHTGVPRNTRIVLCTIILFKCSKISKAT